ncbi:MAG: serine/threonine protein kinase, partial [Bacteroidetes bacterium]|nr:serine/threonine protein kinase [Bacteroidota bacterium]
MIGKTISHYKIIEKLGEGGMGVVYKAEDTKLKREVAIKFLPRFISANKEERQRFEIEAQAAASLNHPNITTIHSIEDVDDQLFIVMEYIDGIELKDKIKSGPISTDEVINIANQIAEGLDVAHKKGIIHRDIKSSNIMITKDGKVKIMDFGLAKIKGGTELTKIGSTVGTAAYMSPEQARGEGVDQRTDIWSFGVVLYEMLTGQLPFKGDYEQAVIYSILNEEPKLITELRRDIPSRLAHIVKRILKKNSKDRYQTTAELVDDLKIVTKDPDGESIIIQQKAGTKKSGRFFSNKKKLLTTSGVIILLIFLSSFLPSGLEFFKSLLGFKSEPSEQHLLVLPLTNIGGDEDKQAFCDGLMETLSSKLTQVEQFDGSLWVVPSSEVIRNKISSPDEAYQRYGVNLAVTGSLQFL